MVKFVIWSGVFIYVYWVFSLEFYWVCSLGNLYGFRCLEAEEMRVFEKRNMSGKDVCPICGGKEEGKVVLVRIDGTEDGNICEVVQVCLDCLELRLDKKSGLIYQVVKAEGVKDDY